MGKEAVTVTGSPGYSSYTDTYTFDVVGNRLTKTDVSGGNTLVSSYTYNDNDELTAESGTLNGSSNYSTTYGYDANGSLTSVARTGAGAETDSYGYDLQNRLATANISRTEQGQAVVIAASYSYDDAGFRAQGVVTTTIGTGSPTTTTTKYLVDVMNPTGYTQVLEEHTNGSATPSMSYLIGLSVFGQTDRAGVTKYFLTDGQGSTRVMVDMVGSIIARLAFDGYGNLLGGTSGVVGTVPTTMLYTGEMFDNNLGKYYLRARFYDPSVGEFTNTDSFLGELESPDTQARYLYTAADPINAVDPSGHFLLGIAITPGRIIAAITVVAAIAIFALVRHIWRLAHLVNRAQITYFYFVAQPLGPAAFAEVRRIFNDCVQRGAPGKSIALRFVPLASRATLRARDPSFGHLDWGVWEVGFDDSLILAAGQAGARSFALNRRVLQEDANEHRVPFDVAAGIAIAHETFYVIGPGSDLFNPNGHETDSPRASIGSTFSDAACRRLLKALDLILQENRNAGGNRQWSCTTGQDHPCPYRLFARSVRLELPCAISPRVCCRHEARYAQVLLRLAVGP